MSERMNNWSVQVIGMAVIATAATAVLWLADGFEAAWPAALILGAFIGVVHFGRSRSNTLEVMSGTGDERVRSLYTRAVAFAGTVMAFVLPGWWMITVAQGAQDYTLAWLSAIFGLSFVVGVVVLARRN